MTTLDRFRDAAADGLVWLPDRGMGMYELALRAGPRAYGRHYWDKYVGYAESEQGKALTAFRRDLVDSYGADVVIDIGIGCGAFIAARGGETRGFDVNRTAVEWLRERHLWADPYRAPFGSATFWDSIEHIEDPGAILRNVMDLVFVTLPIFRDANHVLRSKHFRPEHVWYWTRDGFVRWMSEQDFKLEFHGTQESDIGREDIHTFVFRRRSPALEHRSAA